MREPCGLHVKKIGFTESEKNTPARRVAWSAVFDLLEKENEAFRDRVMFFYILETPDRKWTK